jgi:hypothetical protein
VYTITGLAVVVDAAWYRASFLEESPVKRSNRMTDRCKPVPVFLGVDAIYFGNEMTNEGFLVKGGVIRA